MEAVTQMTRETIIKRFPNASESFIAANLAFGGVAPDPKRERDIENEPVEADAGEAPDEVRCLVRYTCFRVRPIEDQENFFTKHFTDAIVISGYLFDDAQQWCSIEVNQEKVAHKAEERTVIEVIPL